MQQAGEETDKVEEAKEEKLTFPKPPEELREGQRSWKSLLVYFGPGAILASATLGSGETFFAPRGGALFGFAILWTLVFAGFFKGILTYAGIRYYTLTGEHIMSRWAKLPGPRGWFSVVMAILAIVAFPAIASSVGLMAGQIAAWSLGLPMTSSMFATLGTILFAITALLALVGGYGPVEKTQVALVAFLSISIALLAISVTPSIIGILGGLVPSLPGEYATFVQRDYPEIANRPIWVEVVTYMGAVGGGIYDYIGYVGYCKNREWGMLAHRNLKNVQDSVRNLDPGNYIPLDSSEENKDRGRSWLKAPQMDVLISFTAITFFTSAAMILGAVSLREEELIPSGFDMFTFQAQWFTDISPALTIVWQVGVFAAIVGTLYAIWEGYTWTWLESVKPFSERVRQLERERTSLARFITILYVGIVGVVLMWSGLDAVSLITPALLFSGVFGAGLWCWAILWAEKTALPKEWRGGWKLDLGLVVSGLFLTGSGLLSIAAYLGIIGITTP
jgi:Mn2+/Fe2+ NRAMP family transporter